MTSDAQPKRQVYEGAWREVRPFTETISPDCHVRLVVQEPEKTDEEAQKKAEAERHKGLDELVAEAQSLGMY